MKNIFKRYEIKYLLTKDQYENLLDIMKKYMKLDSHGKQVVNNVYFDTPDFKIIRRSLEKPFYKEKLRVRCYGNNHDNVYIELKKKYDGVVYKRRVELNGTEAYDYLVENKSLNEDTQITKEIDYFFKVYENLHPSVFLSYEREAFFGIEDNDFRMTFDHNIKMRDYEVFNFDIEEGKNILSDDMVLLEVKTALGIPRWLLKFLKVNNVYKSSFSKYGHSYKKFILNKEGERKIC